jgi:hypothetical protein
VGLENLQTSAGHELLVHVEGIYVAALAFTGDLWEIIDQGDKWL